MKTLNHFICNDNTLTVTQHPECEGFVAFVSDASISSDVSALLSKENLEHGQLLHGLFQTDWYPVGFGKTVEEAIIDVNIRVSAFLSDEGLNDLYEKAYNYVNCTLFHYSDSETFSLNPIFRASQIPQWLMKFYTITPERLTTLRSALCR